MQGWGTGRRTQAKKEGNDKDREKAHEKIEEKKEVEELRHSNTSGTISINSDFFDADDIEVEICWL
jgi:hypothetical protein